jgi:flavin reductase (DIM6/NTAB) family NADH-FMN oxidoreductase RutF
VHGSFTDRAHYTSAKFATDISEFDRCKFTEEYLEDFRAPFVKESTIKIGMECIQRIPIEINNTSLVIGKIKLVVVPDESIDDRGHINFDLLGTVGISGLNSYYSVQRIGQYPYARPEQMPDFE